MSSLSTHLLLIGAPLRIDAFRRALRKRVRTGSVVADLGCGTGVLGLLALQAGARRVYAVERHPIVHVARALAKENGVEDRVVFLHADSRDVRLPERADVVVSDLVGQIGVDEHLVECMTDARDRWLRRGGHLIPARVDLWARPSHAPGLYRRAVRPGHTCPGLRFDTIHAMAANMPHFLWRAAGNPLAPAARFASFDLERDPKPWPRSGSARFAVARGGTLHGFTAWFTAEFAPGVRVDSRRGGHWKAFFLPLADPPRVRAGDRLDLAVVFHTGQQIEWSAALNGDVIRRQATLLASERAFARTHLPDTAVPRLPSLWRRRLGVLNRIDGRRTLAELSDGTDAKEVCYDLEIPVTG
ncbi:MAG: 50S ribosomal protein L11 methyltransferase [Planctomycetes bacterium]|nr:50S ribosomal protein L11 methyltransferase [Planctomycetota bacterium]